MTPSQMTLAAEVLEMAAEHFGGHSCNDFEIRNTPENLELVNSKRAEDGYEPLKVSGEWIPTMDFRVMYWCAELLRQEAAKPL